MSAPHRESRKSILSTALLSYYRKKYGLELRVLAPVPLPAWTKDEIRHQLIAEELVEAIKRTYPQFAIDPSHHLRSEPGQDHRRGGHAKDARRQAAN